MNARTEHGFREHETVAQEPHNDTKGATVRGEGAGREYTCLDCGRQLDSFPIECSGCGGRQFQTELPGVSETTRSPGYELFETTLARFNPYIPR
jgi:DNA-directed RNA polymerase subunit RPC12/RpoP